MNGEVSSECFANKTVGEKCCDYKDNKQPDWCVARFQGYGREAARQWMAHCRSSAWRDTPASQQQDLQQHKEQLLAAVPSAAVNMGLAPGQSPCRAAGVTLPGPWHRTQDTPEHSCRAPKPPDPFRERCCDYKKPEPYCEASFYGYSAAEVQGWVRHCRMPFWSTSPDDKGQRSSPI